MAVESDLDDFIYQMINVSVELLNTLYGYYIAVRVETERENNEQRCNYRKINERS